MKGKSLPRRCKSQMRWKGLPALPDKCGLREREAALARAQVQEPIIRLRLMSPRSVALMAACSSSRRFMLPSLGLAALRRTELALPELLGRGGPHRW